MSNNNSTSTDSSGSSSSSKDMPTWAAILLVLGWIPALALLFGSMILLIMGVVHLKRRIFGGPRWWVEKQKSEKKEKKKRREGIRASGIRTMSDLLDEMWVRGVECVKGWWTRLPAGKQEVKSQNIDVEMEDTEKQREGAAKPVSKRDDFDVEIGDIEKEKGRDSTSTDGRWSVNTAESFSSVAQILQKEEEAMEIKAMPTTWSRIKSFIQFPFSIFRHPGQPSISATEGKDTKDRIRAVAKEAHKQAAEEAQAMFNRKYEQLIEDIGRKCEPAARVLKAKTPLERSRMDLEWIRENRELYHWCNWMLLGCVTWRENGWSWTGACNI